MADRGKPKAANQNFRQGALFDALVFIIAIAFVAAFFSLVQFIKHRVHHEDCHMAGFESCDMQISPMAKPAIQRLPRQG